MTVPKKVSRRQGKRAAAPTGPVPLQQPPRSTLTQERVVVAGVALADEHGLAAVSIRGIAAQLGSSPMALYHYVPSKRDLLNLILDAVNAEFKPAGGAATSWRSTLSHFARESRRSLKRHPWTSALIASDPEYGPECIRNLESLLTSLSDFGLELRTATRAISVLFVFVNGFVAAETGHSASQRSKTRRSTAHHPNFSRAALATGDFPNVSRFLALGAELPDDDGFERALDWILDGIEAEVTSQNLAPHAKRIPTPRQKRSA